MEHSRWAILRSEVMSDKISLLEGIENQLETIVVGLYVQALTDRADEKIHASKKRLAWIVRPP